jgi:hypothetical protein
MAAVLIRFCHQLKDEGYAPHGSPGFDFFGTTIALPKTIPVENRPVLRSDLRGVTRVPRLLKPSPLLGREWLSSNPTKFPFDIPKFKAMFVSSFALRVRSLMAKAIGRPAHQRISLGGSIHRRWYGGGQLFYMLPQKGMASPFLWATHCQ